MCRITCPPNFSCLSLFCPLLSIHSFSCLLLVSLTTLPLLLTSIGLPLLFLASLSLSSCIYFFVLLLSSCSSCVFLFVIDVSYYYIFITILNSDNFYWTFSFSLFVSHLRSAGTRNNLGNILQLPSFACQSQNCTARDLHVSNCLSS